MIDRKGKAIGVAAALLALLLVFAIAPRLRATNFLYPVTQPIKLYTDTNGTPLDAGYIYFGTANQNPEVSPITMYWDVAGMIPAVQPIRTVRGYITRQGTPANIYATGDFSITIRNSRGALVLTSPVSTDIQLATAVIGSSLAATIAIADAGNYYTTDNVEAAFQQLGPLLAQMVTALASTTITGEVKDYAGTTLPSGYVWASGRTLGDASSGGTERANADTVNLYTLLWNSYANAELTIQDSAGTPTTRGAGASNDFTAHKRLPTPDARGRVRATKDNLGGSTASRLTAAGLGAGQVGTTMGAASTGATGFTETHALTLGELASHTHTVTDPGHNHTQNAHQHAGVIVSTTTAALGTSGASVVNTATSGSTSNFTAINVANTTGITNVAAGSNTPFSNVQPTIVFTTIIKL